MRSRAERASGSGVVPAGSSMMIELKDGLGTKLGFEPAGYHRMVAMERRIALPLLCELTGCELTGCELAGCE